MEKNKKGEYNGSIMLILSEIQGSTYLFDLYHNKICIQTLELNEKEIITAKHLPGFTDKRLTIVLKKEGNRVYFEAGKSILVNGVARRRWTLKKNDTLFLGPYRLTFRGERPEPGTLPLKTSLRKEQGKRLSSHIKHIAEVAAVLASLSFLWFCTTQKPVQKNSPPSVVSRKHETPPFGIKKKQGPAPALSGQEPLIMYAPDEKPAPMKLDILFIHTHPDDETLDYGLYIAKAAEAGRVIGVLTFTDGESGFDFYPDRDTTGIYPDRELHGKDLARVRVEEEEKALKTLGASVYIRLGLKNRPYTAEEARKSLLTIVNEWGGEQFLVKRLTSLFAVFHPDIIVSPDGPSKAREHFEHEAAGYISALAVAAYRKEHPGELQAYLKLVDVQQTRAYPGKDLRTVGFGRGSSSCVQKKRKALLQYETQADACYYGIKRLKKFPFEYYFIAYEKKNSNVTLFLDPEGINVSSRSP